MSQPQSQQLGRAVFHSLANHAARAGAGLVPGGATVYDLVKGVYDEVEKSQYVTHDQLQAALLALTDDQRARLREEALANSHLLTLDQQGRLRATMAVAERALFTQLLAEAEYRDMLAAQEQANTSVQQLRKKLAEQLQESRYKAALKTANKLSALTPYDADLLQTQQQLEVKLSETLLKHLAAAFLGGFIFGGLGGVKWAYDNWHSNGPKVCQVPSIYLPGKCLFYKVEGFFPLDAYYLGRIMIFALCAAILLTAIVCAVEGPRRWQRYRILRRSGGYPRNWNLD